MTEVVGITGVCLALAHDSDNTHHCQGHYTALKKTKLSQDTHILGKN
jgi:hypothetical protein